MVIVLTGSQSINKKFIARPILAQLNKFEYSGFYADFTLTDFSVYDLKTNKLVYKPITNENDHGEDFLIRTKKPVFDYFNLVNNEIFEDGIKHNHFVNVFASLSNEYGIADKPLWTRKDYDVPLKHPHRFEDVLDNIIRSPLDVKVISGTFGNYFLDRLKKALPGEEIKIISITRNPSVSWLLNKKPESKWLTEINPDLTEKVDFDRFYENALQIIEINKRPDVQVIKFEDLMKDGIIKIDETKQVQLPGSWIAANDYINAFEKDMEILMDDSEFEGFNDLISNYTIEDFYKPSNEPGNVNEEEVFGISHKEIYRRASLHFPKNIFKELGYEPVDKDTILK